MRVTPWLSTRDRVLKKIELSPPKWPKGCEPKSWVSCLHSWNDYEVMDSLIWNQGCTYACSCLIIGHPSFSFQPWMSTCTPALWNFHCSSDPWPPPVSLALQLLPQICGVRAAIRPLENAWDFILSASLLTGILAWVTSQYKNSWTMLDPLTCACSFWSTWGRYIAYPDAKHSYCINRAPKNLCSYANSTILHTGDCKQERESLRTSQHNFYEGLFHWSTASSDFVPQGRSRNGWPGR